MSGVIHVGSRKTLHTLCGKPVARRWWVRGVQRGEANCRACRTAMRRKP